MSKYWSILLMLSCTTENPQPKDDGRDRCIHEVAYAIKCNNGIILDSLDPSKCDSLEGFNMYVIKCND